MAKTPSNMIPLGTIAPPFSLIEPLKGEIYSLKKDPKAIGTVILFLCNHCPFVIHIRDALIKIAKSYQAKGIRFIGISSNDPISYPEDGPEKMALLAKALPFPYLFDESQAVAKAYQAACTPDFYLFDAQLACVYRGQFDDARPGNSEPIDGHDLICAMETLIKGQAFDFEQKPSLGCNIKWR